MAGRGPRTPRHDSPRGEAPQDTTQNTPQDTPEDASLVRIRDLAGRPRGTGFVADHHGTVITSHEAVDGLPRLVLHAAGDRSCVVTADAVTPLPELDLALVRTEGLGVAPLPVTVREGAETGGYVRLAAGCWREARVLTETSVTYTATDRCHHLDGALELAIGTSGRDALRLGGGAAGGPVLDAETGAVVAVLGTALRSGHRDTGFAVLLRPRTAAPDGPPTAATLPADATEAHTPPPWPPPTARPTGPGASGAGAPADGGPPARNATTVPAGADDTRTPPPWAPPATRPTGQPSTRGTATAPGAGGGAGAAPSRGARGASRGGGAGAPAGDGPLARNTATVPAGAGEAGTPPPWAPPATRPTGQPSTRGTATAPGAGGGAGAAPSRGARGVPDGAGAPAGDKPPARNATTVPAGADDTRTPPPWAPGAARPTGQPSARGTATASGAGGGTDAAPSWGARGVPGGGGAGAAADGGALAEPLARGAATVSAGAGEACAPPPWAPPAACPTPPGADGGAGAEPSRGARGASRGGGAGAPAGGGPLARGAATVPAGAGGACAPPAWAPPAARPTPPGAGGGAGHPPAWAPAGAWPIGQPSAASTAAVPGGGPLAELLARNAATVPAYGADLNLAGVLELAATSVGSDGPPGALAGRLGHAASGSRTVEAVPVERAAPAQEFAAFALSPTAVLGLVGAPGSGRTTELAALAARRDRGAPPAPTLWLRGADLKDEDDSLADAARRTLVRAARIVAASAGSSGPADLGDVTPERIARFAQSVGRPLLLLLDGPEEMPPLLAHRLADWTEGTAQWLRETGARLVVACRGEYWERAGAEFPPEMLYGSAVPGDPLPPCVRLGDLTAEEAYEARARYSVPEAALAAPDDRHPLTLRLLSEVRAALPGPPVWSPVDRDDVLAAYLDLMCLRIAVRLAAENGLRGAAVRRLAAKVSGQVHEAARRSLGPGQGELDRAAFEAVFPWGPAPARLGGGVGWASAVLAEGLLVPAGGGYRFAHEELADWIQGVHLDLGEALRALVHRRRTPEGGRPLPVPHHRIGPVVQALLLLARQQGPHQLAAQLRELTHALEAEPGSWWAARLLTETLLRVPDATPYTGVLRLLADLIGAGAEGTGRFADFGPAFWTGLALPPDARLDLLRRLVVADGAPQDADAPRYLDAVARLLAADPTVVQPYLTHWFDDERPLPATPHATVATAAQALLHTHRHRALDDLTELLVDCAHPRADELLSVLAEEEPSALCRAVDRWSHDERPARRAAAMTYGLRAAPHLRTDADHRLLRHAALALLARPADGPLHGGALAVLVRDPETRSPYLPQALERFAAGDPQLPPSALLAALSTHPEPVLDAFRTRLGRPDRADAGSVLRALADVTTPAPAHRVAVLVREALERRPETAGHVAAYVDRRLDHGPAARAVLHPLVTGLLDGDGPEQVRAALAGALAAPGAPQSRPLRRELLEHLLRHERAPAVLVAVLHAAAARTGDELRDLVHRTGLLLVRTPDGATRFDSSLVELGRQVPGFAAQVVDWLTEAPGEWAVVVGPSARRTIENLAGVRVPA